MLSRRRFLLASGACTLTAACSKIKLLEVTPQISYPGMREGHLLRDKASLPAPTGEIVTDVAILGSGVAGLSAAWKLSKAGHANFVVINGPEYGGNAAGGQFGDLRYPRGAHYLPLPSMESTHVREMLFDFGIIEANPFSERPYFNESVVLHAPDERLYVNGEWQEGIVPNQGLSPDDAAQQQRFFGYVDSLKSARGADGRKLFAIPLALSSTDPQWTQLDRFTVKQWLTQNGYTSQTLHWYLDYVCRDEYGAGFDRISAWCGLHYFASRGGKARNASDGAVLTWPDGLQPMIKHLSAAITRQRGANNFGNWSQPGVAAHVDETNRGVEVLCVEQSTAGLRTFTVKAKRVICAMPLMVTARIMPQLSSYGFDSAVHIPNYAPWLVSNFLMDGFPSEEKGTPLAWDNVVYQGKGLGYVVSTHQEILVAAPPKTVFSAYQALSTHTPVEARQWLQNATPQQLYQEAACDLKQVYGLRLEEHMQALDITVRGHAMASPLPGFLSNQGLAALRAADGKILFAHADMSSFSVFEEAAWWGCQAALKLIN